MGTSKANACTTKRVLLLQIVTCKRSPPTPWKEILSRAFSARNAYWRPRAAYLGLAQHGRRAWLTNRSQD